MAKSLIPNENAVIENGWNVMLIGAHGTGKSATIRSIADRHNMKVAIYNAATMDPHTELIGIPMPRTVHIYDGATGVSEQREVLRMIRPQQINDCHLVFIDELNRAPVEVQNACMEIANERTINGEPLPNLRCVMTAINPPDGGYNVGLIDEAMIDRWDIYVEVEPCVDAFILTSFDGISEGVAKAAEQWYAECNHAKRETYVSPRRVGKLCKVFEATKSKKMLAAAMPPGTTADVGKLFAMLMAGAGSPLAGSVADAKLASIGADEQETPVKTAKASVKVAASAPKTGVSWIKAKHANPAMIGRVEAAITTHGYADMVAHLEAMPQSTSYRFGVRLGKMVADGSISPVDIPRTTDAFDRFATKAKAKKFAAHVEAAKKALS